MGWKNKTTSLKILAYLLMYFSHSSTVEKKIAAYFEEVKIGGSFCSNCSGNTKKRKIFLAEAPPTLVIEFKRFEFTTEKKKLNWKMQFGASLFIEGMIYF